MPAADTLCLNAKANFFLRLGQQATAHAFTGVPWRSEVVLDSRRHTLSEVGSALCDSILFPTEKPLLLVWSGHGMRGNWVWEYSRRDTKVIPYEEITRLLVRATRPTLILNDACGGGELGELVEQVPSVASRVGVVSACAKGGTADGYFMIQQFLESLRLGEVFEPADEYCEWRVWRPLQEKQADRSFGRLLSGRNPLMRRVTISLAQETYDTVTITHPNAPVRHGTRAIDRTIFSGVT